MHQDEGEREAVVFIAKQQQQRRNGEKEDFKRWLDLINPALFCVFFRSLICYFDSTLGSGWIAPFFFAVLAPLGNHAIIMIMMFAHLLICFRNRFDLRHATWCAVRWGAHVHLAALRPQPCHQHNRCHNGCYRYATITAAACSQIQLSYNKTLDIYSGFLWLWLSLCLCLSLATLFLWLIYWTVKERLLFFLWHIHSRSMFCRRVLHKFEFVK